MSETSDFSVVEPVRWPRDPEASEALRRYVIYLRSEGAEGEELGGVLDFRGADLSGMQLERNFLWGSNFSGVVLDGADLYKAELVGAVLDDASFRGTRLHRTEMGECEARRAVFRGANLLRVKATDAVLVDADFRGAWAGGAAFWSSDLSGADLRGVRFGSGDSGEWANFRESRMAGCRVAGAEGCVVGPVDVGVEKPHLIGGDELETWFAGNGAPEVRVIRP